MVKKSQEVFEGTTVILLGKKKYISHIKETKDSYIIWYIANGASKETLCLVLYSTF